MKFFISLILSLILTILVYSLFMAFIFKLDLIDTFKMAFPVLIGLQGGLFAVSYFVIIPFFMEIISNNQENKKSNSTYNSKETPIKITGEIQSIEIIKANNYKIDITYADTNKIFTNIDIDTSLEFKVGSNITVFYNPKNKQESYIDPYDEIKRNNSSSVSHGKSNSELNTAFKLLEINPLFEIGEYVFQLTGEVHGGGFSGEKVSLTESLNKHDLPKLTPGKIFSCNIHKDKNELFISLNINWETYRLFNL